MIERRELIAVLETGLEKLLRICFFWIRTDEEFVWYVDLLHISVLIALYALCICIRLFDLPSIVIYGLFFVLSVIWAQHIALGTCLLTHMKKRIAGKKFKLLTELLNVFGIPETRETLRGMTNMCSSLLVGLVFLELLRRWINS